MNDAMILNILIFAVVAMVVVAIGSIVKRMDRRVANRIDQIHKSAIIQASGTITLGSGGNSFFEKLARDTLPKVGKIIIPTSDEERTLLQTRLIQCGFYRKNAMHLFLATKLLLIVTPFTLAFLVMVVLGLPPKVLIYPAIMGMAGMIGPSFYLDRRKKQRQITFRRALPDALDLLVVCVEGGLSLPAAIKRISVELMGTHFDLSSELNLVQKQIQMGMTPGEALEQLGFRSDLEEIRQLSAVVSQSERFGASITKSLRLAAETLRLRRQQHAEEMAQKAAVKILIPTLLFIFPALFVVILGPAAFQIMEMFANMN
jgi:tight adherence protein C